MRCCPVKPGCLPGGYAVIILENPFRIHISGKKLTVVMGKVIGGIVMTADCFDLCMNCLRLSDFYQLRFFMHNWRWTSGAEFLEGMEIVVDLQMFFPVTGFYQFPTVTSGFQILFWTQNPPLATAYRFESGHRHQKREPRPGVLFFGIQGGTDSNLSKCNSPVDCCYPAFPPGAP